MSIARQSGEEVGLAPCGLERRRFLHLVGGTAGAAFLASSLPSWAGNAQPRRRVIVIGAGLAGLAAAYELKRHGHRVVVLEARPHLGGRVLTLRHPFDDQLYAEAGGEWVDPRHDYILHYVREFELALERDSEAHALWDSASLQALAEAEESIPGMSELQQQLQAHREEVDIFERPDRSALAHLDRLSYLDFLRQLGASEAAIAYERIFVNTEMTVDISEISALHMLYEFGLSQPEMIPSRISGGNDGLIKSFAQRLGNSLRLGAAVNSIEWDTRGVRVQYRQRDTEHTEDGDHVVVAIPGTQVRRVSFQPPLPSEVSRAYSALGYGRVIKTILQAHKRFWEKASPAYQWVFTHREANHVYHSSWGQPGPRGLLTCYIAGWGAERWGALPSGELVTAARKLLGEIWAGGETEIEKGATWFWNRQRWIDGSYAFFAPGQMTTLRPWLSEPVGRIHFAGEHTAAWQGYMNGAVESGLRVAAEIEPAIETLFKELTARSRSDAASGVEPVAA